jgi:hypothetical protein
LPKVRAQSTPEMPGSKVLWSIGPMSFASVPRRPSMGRAPENQVRTGLPAGGKRIRTLGPRPNKRRSRDRPFRLCGTSRSAEETGSFRERDRQFESASLQQRVSREISFLHRCGAHVCNRTYADMARHYGTAIVPARPYKPRDKAKVEVGVQVVGCWILARLRHRRFFSRVELNAAIHALLDDLNDRPMRGWGMSQRALFEQLDKPALRSLPPLAYEYAEWKRCRVGLDYHVEIAKHYYSVPHQLIRQEVEARITAATIEIFHRGKRVASHRHSLRPHRPTTVSEHMPGLRFPVDHKRKLV